MENIPVLYNVSTIGPLSFAIYRYARSPFLSLTQRDVARVRVFCPPPRGGGALTILRVKYVGGCGGMGRGNCCDPPPPFYETTTTTTMPVHTHPPQRLQHYHGSRSFHSFRKKAGIMNDDEERDETFQRFSGELFFPLEHGVKKNCNFLVVSPPPPYTQRRRQQPT